MEEWCKQDGAVLLQVSHKKNSGVLVVYGDYTTQFDRDFKIDHSKDPGLNNQDSMESI